MADCGDADHGRLRRLLAADADRPRDRRGCDVYGCRLRRAAARDRGRSLHAGAAHRSILRTLGGTTRKARDAPLPTLTAVYSGAQEWKSRTLRNITEQMRLWLLHEHWLDEHPEEAHDVGKMALHVFDLTGDDHVSFTEFVTAARSKLGVRVSNARLRKLWRESLDPEGRGRVHYKELANALLPHLNDHVADMLVADNNIDDGGYRSGQVEPPVPAIIPPP